MKSWIRCVIFDLDGVLCDTKHLHFEALNVALEGVNPDFCVDEEWYYRYDGITTKQKLEILSKEKGFPVELHERIMSSKAQHTLRLIHETVKPNHEKIQLLSRLKQFHDVKIAIASNSRSAFVEAILHKTGLRKFVDYVLGGDKVKFTKPNACIYLNCMSTFGVSPSETVVFEDAPAGRKAALDSGAHLVQVDSVNDVTLPFVIREIRNAERNCRFNQFDATILYGLKNVNVLVPMAGKGQRFLDQGFQDPKPFIKVRGKSLVQVTIDSISIPGRYIFCALEDHKIKFPGEFTELLNHDDKLVIVDDHTQGAACTTLLAEEHINNDDPLFIINCDQYIEWDWNRFMVEAAASEADGGIVTFEATGNKWSYVENDGEFSNRVVRVAEKDPISTHATVGIYFWRKGSDYVKYAKQMIEKEIRVNGEFYVCPVYNEAIQDGKKIISFPSQRFLGLGTPDDLLFNASRL